MTAKRFMLDDCGELIDLNNHKFVDYGEECCNLLNKLHEENTMLKERRHEDINELSVIAMRYKALEKENKQLKQYKKAIWDCDSSKIIRVNKNTGEVDLIDKELEE